MVVIKRVIIPKPAAPAGPSPLMPVELVINELPTTGRVYEFDQPPVDKEGIRGADGKLIRPTKCMTTCPECGIGLHIGLNLTSDPPYPIQAVTCTDITECPKRPALKAMPDPFVNPFENGDVDIHGFDDAAVVQKTTVADRLKKRELPKAEGLTPEEDIP